VDEAAGGVGKELGAKHRGDCSGRVPKLKVRMQGACPHTSAA
jgi:hypothetical protein